MGHAMQKQSPAEATVVKVVISSPSVGPFSARKSSDSSHSATDASGAEQKYFVATEADILKQTKTDNLRDAILLARKILNKPFPPAQGQATASVHPEKSADINPNEGLSPEEIQEVLQEAHKHLIEPENLIDAIKKIELEAQPGKNPKGHRRKNTEAWLKKNHHSRGGSILDKPVKKEGGCSCW